MSDRTPSNRREAPTAPPTVLLVVARRQTRAYLLAELEEAGYEVTTAAGVCFAVKSLLAELPAPSLVVVDTQDDRDATPEQVAGLLDMAPGAAAIVIASALEREALAPLSARLAALLLRPVSIGQIVATIRRIVPPA